jgi:hypothetical protein
MDVERGQNLLRVSLSSALCLKAYSIGYLLTDVIGRMWLGVGPDLRQHGF